MRRHPVRYTLLIPILTGRNPNAVDIARTTIPNGPVIRMTMMTTKIKHDLFSSKVSIRLMILDMIFPQRMVEW